MTGPFQQLSALLRLRWQMARTPGLRLLMVLGLIALGWLFYLVVGTADSINPIALATAIDIAPLAFLGFGALALIAPLTAGGGTEVVPPDQLVAYPVRAETQFLGGLILAPLNLVWAVQLLALAALTSYLSFGGSLIAAAVTTTAFVVFITVLGQALAWFIVGLRQTRPGRGLVNGAGVILLLAAIAVARADKLAEVQQASPTKHVVLAISQGALGNYGPWALTTAALLSLAAVALYCGGRACRWALLRPGDIGSYRRTARVRRRGPRPTPLRELIAVDRASVWRAPALRRGGLVLVLLPGMVAAGAALPWESLVVLPGLVAAGAGLLFGVNAFSLDASGSVWLASLPHDPALALRSKAIVLFETVFAAVIVAAAAGSIRSPGSPSGSEMSAILASGFVCTAVVVVTGLKLSLRHPHRADLRGPRDAVAPPGSLAMASIRLAVPTAMVGMLMGGIAQAGLWWLPLGLAVPLLMLCGLSLRSSIRRWQDPFVRARIVQTVAAG